MSFWNPQPGNTNASITPTVNTAILIIICTIGLGSNSLAFVVILKSSIIKVSTGVFLAFLAILDNLCLILNLIRTFLNINHLNYFSCKIITTGLPLFPRLSWHVLVWMTIDRCYITVNPGTSNLKRRRALIISIVVISLTTLVYSSLLGNMFGITKISADSFNTTGANATLLETPMATNMENEISCSMLPGHERSMKIYIPIDVLTWSLVAPITVLISNLIIIIYLKKHSTVAPANVDTSSSQRERKVTKLLIAVSLCYVLFILPKGIYFTLIPHLYDNVSEAISMKNAAFQVINNLNLLNHSTNFFLYLLSNKTFRRETQLVFTPFLAFFTRNQQNSNVEINLS